MKPKLTIEQEKEVIELKRNGYKNEIIRNKYNISQTCLQKIILRNEREHLITNKKYSINENYFEKIDNEEKSYWLGFLYADGYVRLYKNRSGQLKLKLKNTEIKHLELFNKCTESNYPILNNIKSDVVVNGVIHSSLCCILNIYNTKLVKDLFKWGCINKKSSIIEFPHFLNNELMKHFIRGYFDGDGSICDLCVSFVSGSYNFLISLKNYLNKQILNIETEFKINNNKKYYYIAFTNQKFFTNFYNFIYSNSKIYLKRKKDKFDFTILNKTYSIIQMFDDNGNIIKTWNHINDCSKELKVETRKIMKMIKGEVHNSLNLKLGTNKKFSDDILLKYEKNNFIKYFKLYEIIYT